MFSVSKYICNRILRSTILSDKPSIEIVRHADPILEEGVGSIMLTCVADSNPPSTITWSKKGEYSNKQNTEMIMFDPVVREDGGTYTCQAENSVGWSEERSEDVDVLCKNMIQNIYNYMTVYYSHP